jgi:Glucose-6-phosphate dehydrogenase, NAD binding domain
VVRAAGWVRRVPSGLCPLLAVSRRSGHYHVKAANQTALRLARGSVPRPDNHVIEVFRATGDLARRKLLPGLSHLTAAGLMPDRYGSSAHPAGA